MQRFTGNLVALKDNVIISDMDFGERVTAGGIILRSDNGKSVGIRARWGQVFVVGPEQQDVKPNEWVLVEHGRWSRGFELTDATGIKRTIRKVDTNAILAVSEEAPSNNDYINGDAV